MQQTNTRNIIMALQVAILLTLSNTLGASTLIVGINDAPIGSSDQDYQDVALSIVGVDVISPTGAWQPLPTPNETGIPYWSGVSSDCPQGNIGYWITGTGCFASGNQPTESYNLPGPSPQWPVANTEWYGNPDGTAVGLIFSPTSATVTVDAAYSSLSASNIVGYDYISDPGVLFTLFTGSSVGDSATFTPTGAFELWVKTAGLGGQVYSSDTAGEQHFVVFRNTSLDKLTSGTPEGSTWVMLLIGGAMIAQRFGRRIHHRSL